MQASRKSNPILTLMTDFGTRDGYVAAVKGVILDLAPGARIVDALHEVPAHDVRAASWALAQYVPFFPKGTIHVAVVDPGVGTDRGILAIDAFGQVVLAPDNGLAGWVRLRDPAHRLWMLKSGVVRPGGDSATFHGRDVFAYAAGLLARGTPLGKLAEPARGCVESPWVRPVLHGKELIGEIVHIDRFGNAITNIPGERALAIESPVVRIGRAKLLGIHRTYADVAVGRPLALVSSDGMLEIAVREGNAASRFGLAAGAAVRLGPADA